MKKNLCAIYVAFFFFLISNALVFPQQNDCKGAFMALNGGEDMSGFFITAKDKYKINTVVETGTYLGWSTAFFSDYFDQVHTIEIVQHNYEIAGDFLKNRANVFIHLGSSEKVLSALLPSLADRPVLFYLDAHWEKYWPLLDELKEISKTHRDNCIIVIDDFKVPNRPDIPYDRYGPHECSLAYVHESLKKVFTQYYYFYLIPANPLHRAKFVVMPYAWKNL